MRTLSLTLTITLSILCCSTTPAGAEGKRAETITLEKDGRLTFRKYGSPDLDLDLTLDAERFVIDRPGLDYYNLVEKGLIKCSKDLSASKKLACENCTPDEPPLFGSIGLPAIIGGAVVVTAVGFVVGVLVGFELDQLATVAAP